MTTAKQVYEDFMNCLICPSKFKEFNSENFKWLKKQVSDKRIVDTVLHAEMRAKVEEIEILLSE